MKNKKDKKIKKKTVQRSSKIKFQAFGKTIEEAFSNSLIAMFSSMYDEKVERKYSHKIKVKGKDIENLLYNFLGKFLFLFENKGIFVSSVDGIKIDLNNNELYCFVSGDVSKKYKIHTKVKSVNYNNMIIKEEKGLWMIQVVLDI
jgi:SHS2 domain-containing protein